MGKISMRRVRDDLVFEATLGEIDGDPVKTTYTYGVGGMSDAEVGDFVEQYQPEVEALVEVETERWIAERPEENDGP